MLKIWTKVNLNYCLSLRDFEGSDEMKTKYKFIHFEKIGNSGKIWRCKNKADTEFGRIDNSYSKGMCMFHPEYEASINQNQLIDISHFLGQLNDREDGE